jgi:hypothetical protein
MAAAMAGKLGLTPSPGAHQLFFYYLGIPFVLGFIRKYDVLVHS